LPWSSAGDPVIPFLDTGFVIAKRLKYAASRVGRRQPLPSPDGRIGFSQRKTVAYL